MNSTYGYNNWCKWPSLACKRGHVCQPHGFMYGTFPTSGTMQHPSFGVAQGLWLTAYLPTNHDSLPPNPSSLIFIFNFLSISDLQLSKSTYIWICESARVGSCVQLFYIPWSCVRCSDYITAEVCCISMHFVHSQTQAHANILNCSSESCLIAFPPPCMKLEKMHFRFDTVSRVRFLITDLPVFAHVLEHRPGAFHSFMNFRMLIVSSFLLHQFFLIFVNVLWNVITKVVQYVHIYIYI